MSAADLLAYQRTLALSKMAAANRARMGQHALKPASLGMDAGASPAIYDGGFQGANTASQQQLMYY
jgi:nucleolysin TIA-1/TIAR